MTPELRQRFIDAATALVAAQEHAEAHQPTLGVLQGEAHKAMSAARVQLQSVLADIQKADPHARAIHFRGLMFVPVVIQQDKIRLNFTAIIPDQRIIEVE